MIVVLARNPLAGIESRRLCESRLVEVGLGSGAVNRCCRGTRERALPSLGGSACR